MKRRVERDGQHGVVMDMERAIEVFVRAMAYLGSFTAPSIAERIGPLWVIRDAPRRRGEYRKEEWICRGVPSGEVDRLARSQTRGRYFVCAITASGEDPAQVRDEFKDLGYRLIATEGFFVHDLKELPNRPCPFSILRVLESGLADRLNKVARTRQVLPEHLADPDGPLRQYVALAGKAPIGWVRSVTVQDATWCSNLYVDSAYRRHGVGSALMAKMLLDDAEAGSRGSVLLASHAGSMLYPQLGYRRMGDLMILSPPRPDPKSL